MAYEVIQENFYLRQFFPLKYILCFFFRYSKYPQILIDVLNIPVKLPFSEQAACYQGFRVRLQIIRWKMLDEIIVKSKKYGLEKR